MQMSRLLTIFMITIHLLYIVTILGIYYVNPEYIRMMTSIVQTFVAVFLLWRFRPFTQPVLTPFDSQVIFMCASFLFINVVVIEMVNYLKNIPLLEKPISKIETDANHLFTILPHNPNPNSSQNIQNTN